MPIQTSISSDGSVFNFTLSGDFDINHSLQIQDTINTLPHSVRLVRIDMQDVITLDTAIFATLLLLYYDKDSSVKVEVFNCAKALAQRLSLAGLDRLITIRMSATETSMKSDISDDASSQGQEST